MCAVRKNLERRRGVQGEKLSAEAGERRSGGGPGSEARKREKGQATTGKK